PLPVPFCPTDLLNPLFPMLPPPPRPPLFPYTTLFRSPTLGGRARHHQEQRPALRGLPALRGRRRDREALRAQARRRPRAQGFPIDRKSTRLNSSHVESSYAVFCLKKKNRHAHKGHPAT